MSVANAAYADDTFELNAGEYVPQGTTILPQPGNYRIKVTSMKRKTDKNGQVVMFDGKYFITTIQRIEIVEPQDENGQFAIFQDVRTSPYNRKGQGGRMVAASEAADVLVAVDRESLEGLVDFADVAKEMEQRLKSGSQANVYIGYTGYDKQQAQTALAKLGPNPSKEAVQEAYNSARLNTKDFRGPNGVALAAVRGPSGQMVEAKLKITSWIPADKDVELGPTTVKGKNA